MPELPEVNTYQKYFDAAAVGQTIAAVEVSDDYIIKQVGELTGNTTAASSQPGVLGVRFAERLSGKTFTGSHRRGKYLFGDLDNGHAVLLHFGMTGDLKLYTDADERPKHERLAFIFRDGQRLGFDDPRKFAKIRYLESREAYVQDIGLGCDALTISRRDFLEQASGRRTALKAFLLNQGAVAGVGNLYADEICYQTRIHPNSSVAGLSPKQLRQVHRAMVDILQTACARDAYYRDYPEDWFWQWRKLEHVAQRGPVRRMTVGGRTTHWVEGWQRLYSAADSEIGMAAEAPSAPGATQSSPTES